jgi:hypothetical protein
MRVELHTDGGIHGRGVGGVIIDDDEVTAIDFGRRLQGRLTFNERDALQRAIGRLEIHPPHTNAEAVRDAIRYALTMDAFGRPLSTHSWNGDEASPTVLALRDVVWKIRERVLGS